MEKFPAWMSHAHEGVRLGVPGSIALVMTPWRDKHVVADIRDPKARTSMTLDGPIRANRQIRANRLILANRIRVPELNPLFANRTSRG